MQHSDKKETRGARKCNIAKQIINQWASCFIILMNTLNLRTSRGMEPCSVRVCPSARFQPTAHPAFPLLSPSISSDHSVRLLSQSAMCVHIFRHHLFSLLKDPFGLSPVRLAREGMESLSPPPCHPLRVCCVELV